ncbi:MAG: large-conductance mechanosensitive channel protein MscL [Candidatus Moraniibacteriota bacterium]
MLKEFKQFAMKGNVVDLAVGVVIGTAFGKIVSSFVSDIIMPPLGVLTGGVDFSKLAWTLKVATKTAPAITMNYGMFINAVVDFLIISFSIFIVIKQLDKFKKKEEAKPAEPSKEVKLLAEIRDLLKKD